MRDAGGDLQRGAGGLQRGAGRPGERRRVRLRVEDPAASAAPGRVDEDGVVRGGVDLGDIGAPHLDQGVQPERGGVGAGHLGGQRVAVHGEDGDAPAGERDGVTTDPAAEIGDAAHAGRGEPAYPVGGDRRTGRLLDTVRREEHPVRVLGTELRHRPLPQPCLPQRRRNQCCRVAAAKPGRGGELLGGVVGPQLGQERRALRGAQCREGGERVGERVGGTGRGARVARVARVCRAGRGEGVHRPIVSQPGDRSGPGGGVGPSDRSAAVSIQDHVVLRQKEEFAMTGRRPGCEVPRAVMKITTDKRARGTPWCGPEDHV